MSSRLSPYRRNVVHQPAAQPKQQGLSRLADRSPLVRSRIAPHQLQPKSSPTPDRKPSQASYHFKVTQRKRNDSQLKIETLLQQNKYLLSQNSELSALVTERGQMILTLEEKLEQQMNQEVRTLEEIEFQKNRFIHEFQVKTREYDKRVEGLLEQIGHLHDTIYNLQLHKHTEIDDIKVHLSIQHKRQIQSLLETHHKTTEILQLQANKLRQLIQHKQNQYNELEFQFKSHTQRERQEIVSLNQQITHLNHMKRLQLSQQKVQYENIIHSRSRENKKQQEITVLNYQMELKKIRNQLHLKRIEAEQLKSQVQMGKIENQTKENQMVQKKATLETEILQLQRKNREVMFREKQHLKKVNESELTITAATHQSQTQHLQSQIQKLKSIVASKVQQINHLMQQLNNLRSTKDQQIRLLQSTISQLKQKLFDMKLDNHQDDEAFKVKMAHLRHADLESFKAYYENQIAVQLQDLENRQLVIKQNREKVHKEIQEKTELRKVFQSEVSKLKVRIGELELKLAEGASERRQQHANMNSKIELTSMSLIRQTSQKQKYALFYDQERRKYQTLITTKDSQISTLEQKINQLKQDYEQQVQQKQNTVDLVNKKCQSLEISLKKEQLFYENQLKKKEIQNNNDRVFYEGQLQKMKEQHSKEYGQTIDNFAMEKSILEAERTQLHVRVKELSAELAKTKEHRDQEGLDKDIALQQEKNRLKSEKGLLEVSLKNFYENQIKQKNQNIKDLHQQIRQKEEDIRQLTEKYHKLQKKLNQLLHSQEKLRDIENKVMAVGEDNSAIKSLAQLLRNRRKG